MADMAGWVRMADIVTGFGVLVAALAAFAMRTRPPVAGSDDTPVMADRDQQSPAAEAVAQLLEDNDVLLELRSPRDVEEFAVEDGHGRTRTYQGLYTLHVAPRGPEQAGSA